jgi:hypothetical protein
MWAGSIGKYARLSESMEDVAVQKLVQKVDHFNANLRRWRSGREYQRFEAGLVEIVYAAKQLLRGGPRAHAIAAEALRIATLVRKMLDHIDDAEEYGSAARRRIEADLARFKRGL